MLTIISGEKLAFPFNTEIKFKLAMKAETKLWTERIPEQQVLLQCQQPFSKLQDLKTNKTEVLIVSICCC